MAINIPIISEFSDAGIKAAKAAFGNFKTAVADAEGGMGKFKAGSQVALDAVAANAGTFALAAGAAIGKFVADGITAFQDLALGAGKFADATGLAVEDASRYIEAAGDIGIPVDAVEAAIGRLNKTIGADPDKVRDLGVDLVYLRDGSLDVNETFKNTIDRIKGIKDPAEKAKVATQLLGKGWQTMAVLIEDGSAKLDESLRKVSDQKIITEAELKMAEDYRDAMNGLGDATEDLKVKSGQRLIPLITLFAEGATKLFELDAAFNELLLDIVGKGTQSVNTELKDLASNARDARTDIDLLKDAIKNAAPLPEITNTYEKLADKVKAVAVEMSADQFDRFYEVQKKTVDVINPDRIDNFRLKLDDLAGVMSADTWERFMTDLDDPIVRVLPDRLDKVRVATERVYYELKNASDAWDILTGNLNEEVALDDAKIALEELEIAAANAFGSGSQKLIDEYDIKAAEFADQLSKISGEMDNISSKEILFKFKTEGPAAALEYARYLARGAEYGGISQYDALTLAGISGTRASGGPVAPGGTYLVGERGPELFTPSSSGNITPNSAMGGTNITVNAGLISTPDQIGQQIIEAILKAQRRSGQVFASA